MRWCEQGRVKDEKEMYEMGEEELRRESSCQKLRLADTSQELYIYKYKYIELSRQDTSRRVTWTTDTLDVCNPSNRPRPLH